MMMSMTLTWTNTSGGLWDMTSDWDLNRCPAAGDSALIDQTGSYAVTIQPSDMINLSNLMLNNSGAMLALDGTLAAAGTAAVTAGTMAVQGSLSAAAIMDNAMLAFVGSHTLDGMPISIGNGGMLQVWNLASGPSPTLTLGPSETVTETGSAAMFGSTLVNQESIVNQGTILGAVAGGNMRIVPLEFTNSGMISVSNEALTIGYDDMQIGGVRGPWSNTGTIALAGTASLTLDGSVTTAGLGMITGANGVSVAGILDNSNNTLVVGTGTLGPMRLLNAGIISGGTIVDVGGGMVSMGNDTLNGVTYEGTLALMNETEMLNIDGSLAMVGAGGIGRGTIVVSGGNQAHLNFNGDQTLDNTMVMLDSSDGLTPQVGIENSGTVGATLTFGPNVMVSSTIAGTQAFLESASQQSTAMVNNGSISAAAAGGSFLINPVQGFTNNGMISVGNGDVLKLMTAIVPGSAEGTIEIGTGGMFDVGGGVAADQSVMFTDPGTLLLHQPSSFAASIMGFAAGDTIDLAGITADSAVWSAGTLTVSNAGSAVAALPLNGNYAGVGFTVSSDQQGGSEIVSCFATGTRIRTVRGEVAVEDLAEGDVVATAIDGSEAPIIWIGHCTVDCARHPKPPTVWPVRISAGAFGTGLPARELTLSPDHAVYVNAVLIPVKYLVNGRTIVQEPVDRVTYRHLELPRHDVMFAEGLPAESYLDVGDRTNFANGGKVMRLFPDFSTPAFDIAVMWEAMGCAPLVVTGPKLAVARALVAAVADAASAGRPGGDADQPPDAGHREPHRRARSKLGGVWFPPQVSVGPPVG